MTPARFDQSLTFKENLHGALADCVRAADLAEDAILDYDKDEAVEALVRCIEAALSKARDARHQLSQETRKL